VTPPEPDLLQPRRATLAIAAGVLAVILCVAVLGAVGAWRGDPLLASSGDAAAEVEARPLFPEPPPLRVEVRTAQLARNETVGQALSRLGLDAALAKSVIGALSGDFPFRRARPGDQLRVERVEGAAGLRRFAYRQGAADEWIVQPDVSGALRARKREVQVEREVALVSVDVQGSVYESLARAGEDPALAVAAADVLAWDVDFYQDVRAGDRLRILVEKVLAEGELLRYGEVLAAEYEGAETGRKRLFRYTDPTGRTGYYDEHGTAARRGFLRSPMRYTATVSSGFGSRRHPILGYQRAHQGVDYRAPTGTPVWSVGDGVVTLAGWNGGCGKTVAVRHENGLESIYCHLSSISVRVGARVDQKQTLGAVGSTGLSTGPHLHFAVKRAGAYVNPLGLKVPRTAPLAPAHRPDFELKVAALRDALSGAVASLGLPGGID
jgi:murein DD-endopeptidase MepM/ murein hydrolase activator NlpD